MPLRLRNDRELRNDIGLTQDASSVPKDDIINQTRFINPQRSAENDWMGINIGRLPRRAIQYLEAMRVVQLDIVQTHLHTSLRLLLPRLDDVHGTLHTLVFSLPRIPR